MVAEEVLFDSEDWCQSSSTQELGRNPATASQARTGVSQGQARGPYVCGKCNKPYSKQHELNRHMKRHTKPWACTFASEGCKHRYAEKKELDRHVQTYHSAQKPNIKCDACLKAFTRQDNLTRHRKICRR
ncbi:hypothetical protein LZ30DRAFT_767809 [Colletotrichum cereale]|nr:hypothetical protein LZ30DRAFT_767809 [Colletotrichum cereale]